MENNCYPQIPTVPNYDVRKFFGKRWDNLSHRVLNVEDKMKQVIKKRNSHLDKLTKMNKVLGIIKIVCLFSAIAIGAGGITSTATVAGLPIGLGVSSLSLAIAGSSAIVAGAQKKKREKLEKSRKGMDTTANIAII